MLVQLPDVGTILTAKSLLNRLHAHFIKPFTVWNGSIGFVKGLDGGKKFLFYDNSWLGSTPNSFLNAIVKLLRLA
jgi:hypothetical protein